MKKLVNFILFLLLVCPLPCQAAQTPAFRVLASTFPVYLFTRNICAGIDGVKVELLVPAQVGCPHDFALKPADMARLDKASALVINGDGLEEFLDKMLAGKKDMKVIDAAHDVPTLEAADSGHGHEHVNPHIFAAPAQAAMMCDNIATELARLDPVHAEAYMENARPYIRSLLALDENFAAIGAMAENRKVAIAHDALAYLMANAGLEVIAIMQNSDSVARLAALKKEFAENRPVLLAGDAQYPDRLLKTLSDETGVPFALFDVCASGPDNAPLDFYQKRMEENLKILEQYFE